MPWRLVAPGAVMLISLGLADGPAAPAFAEGFGAAGPASAEGFGAAGPAFAKGFGAAAQGSVRQQNWDRCIGSDPDASIAGCTTLPLLNTRP